MNGTRNSADAHGGHRQTGPSYAGKRGGVDTVMASNNDERTLLNGDGLHSDILLTKSDVSQLSATPPPPADNERDALSAMTHRNKQQEERVLQLINNAKLERSVVLELPKLGLKSVPPELLELSNLQYLYLEGNELTSLPDDFFDRLPELRWLDLRRNYLASLPSTYIGSHRNLKTLLLEGNELKTLPLEMGLIPTLNGLNICNNPLEFPPSEVIERGTQAVLQFLRDLLKAKSQGRLDDEADLKQYTQYLNLDLTGAPRMEGLYLDSDQESENSSASDDWHPSHSRGGGRGHGGGGGLSSSDGAGRRAPHGGGGGGGGSGSRDSGGGASSDAELFGPVPTSAALHKPTSYNEIKQKQIDKFRRAGAMGTVEKKPKKKKDKKVMKVSMYPEPPSQDRLKQRFLEEQRLYRERDLNDKEQHVLQRRRDREELRRWRDDGKVLQNERYKEARLYGGAKEQIDIATKAPFGIEKDHLKLPTNEERIAQAVKESHEKMRKRRVLSPRSQAKFEAERVARDKQLEKRIKSHMLSMQDRRRAPKGTPQEEMEAARKELDIANQLHAEIEERRKQLEYRFTAFTG